EDTRAREQRSEVGRPEDPVAGGPLLGRQGPREARELDDRRGDPEGAEEDEGDADEGRARVRPGIGGVPGDHPEEEAEARDDEAEADDGEPGPHPREERALGSEEDARIAAL